MNDAMVERVTDEVLRRLGEGRPRALLIGNCPDTNCGYELVREMPYEAVVIGSLSLSELLHFDCEPALTALLEDKPVYLAESGLASRRYRTTRNRVLWSRLQEAERQLRQLGVQLLAEPDSRRVITAQQARALLQQGRSAPQGAVLTPLARDILEGKSE